MRRQRKETVTDRDPTPLRERTDKVGTAVRQYAQATEPDARQGLVFAGMKSRSRAPGRVLFLVAGVVGVVAPVLWFVLKPPVVEVAVRMAEPATQPAPPAPVAQSAPIIRRETTPRTRHRQAPRPETRSNETAAVSDATDETLLFAVAQQLREAGHLWEAMTAFEDQRTRFPQGVLRADADRAIVELLVRLGRPAEALVDSELGLALLLAPEQKAALHVLRGRIYRDVFGDEKQAAHEYGLAKDLQKKP
jgi:hypothetical protein